MAFYKIHGVRALIYRDGKLLILKRANSDKSDANLWDLPGGKIEGNESVSDAVTREVFEETGLNEESISLSNLHGTIIENFGSSNKLVIAVYVFQSSTENITLNEEHSDYHWIKPKDLSLYDLGRILQALKLSLVTL